MATRGAAIAGRPSLDELITRYLSAAIPVHREDSTVEMVVDGRAWMRRMRALLSTLGAGDAAYICGLQLEPNMDLTGRLPTEPGYEPLGGILADLAAADVDVRVLLAGAVVASSLVRHPIGPFHDNVQSADRLRRWRPAGRQSGPPPLRGRVLLDWSGTGIGSNHQKMTIVRRGTEVTAAVGGIDYAASRIDDGPHQRLAVRGGRWGWHDAGAIVRGPAAADIWQVFGSGGSAPYSCRVAAISGHPGAFRCSTRPRTARMSNRRQPKTSVRHPVSPARSCAR